MPFQLKKVNSRGWKVVDDKGREYSRRPLTKTRATAQLRALYAAYNRGEFKEVKGGYIVKHDGADHTIMYGSGFFSDVFDKVKRVAKSAVRVIRRIPPLRRDYPPNVRKVLEQYGNGVIVGLAVRREPIKSFINTALNWLTKGKWDMAKREANYDNLFHLGLVADVEVGNEVKRLLIEKNEVINITTSFGQASDVEMLPLSVPTNPPITLNQLLENARRDMGENFFLYDAFKNNCQDFIYNLLNSSGILTERASAFIKQPIEVLLKRLPSYTPIAARAITDIAGIANRVIYGEGCCAECSVGKSCRSASGGMSIVNRGVRLKPVAVPMSGGSFFSDMLWGMSEVMPGLKGVARKATSEHDKQVASNFFKRFLELREKYGEAEARRMIGGVPIGRGVGEDGDLKQMAGGSIVSQLKLLNIPKTKYLKSIRDAGQKEGYAPKDIDLADDGEHKIMVRTPEGAMRYAGRVGYGDFHIYSLLESKGDVPKGTATEKQKSYRARATKIKGDWKSDKYSPNSLAISLLW